MRIRNGSGTTFRRAETSSPLLSIPPQVAGVPPSAYRSAYLFIPPIWWIGFGRDRPGAAVRMLQMYAQGVRPPSVFGRLAKLEAFRESARGARS